MNHIDLKRFEKILTRRGDRISSLSTLRPMGQTECPQNFQSFVDGFTRHVKFRFQIAQLPGEPGCVQVLKNPDVNLL